MEKNYKIAISIISIMAMMLCFQNCTELDSQQFDNTSSQNSIQDQIEKLGSEKGDDPLPREHSDSVRIFNNPMALFINCGTHYDKSKQNIADLNPGLVRVFVSDWKRAIAIERNLKCMEELVTEDRVFLLQFTKIYKDDDLNAFEEVLHLFNDKFGDKIKYWQIGNEYDHDNSQNFPVGADEVDEFVERLNHVQTFLRQNSPQAKLTLSLTSKVFDADKPQRLQKFTSLRRALTKNFTGENLSLDIHYHHDFEDAENIVVPIKRILNRFQSYKTDFILTENNTHTGQSMRRNSEGEVVKELHFQTEEMQASYGLRTVALALSKGAKHTTFGYPIDRPNFGNPLWVDHHFALNGLFYNPDKNYADGVVRNGPKRSAYSYWLLSQLFQRQAIEYPSSPYIVTFEGKGTTGQHIVSFKPSQNKGKGFKLIWFTKYDSDDQFKTYELNINPETHATFNASKVGKRAGWPPSSLEDFIDSFDITKRRGAFKNIRLKKSDTFIVIDR